MEFRDYLGVIRRRYYVFIPVFLAIVALHFIWVNYGQKPNFVANAHLAVMMPHTSNQQTDSFSPLFWVRTTSPGAVVMACENRQVQEKIADLIWGERSFTLPDFCEEQPFKDKIPEYLKLVQSEYPQKLDFIADLPDYLEAVHDPNQSVVMLRATAESEGKALIIAWAAADGIVQHFNAHIEKGLSHIEKMFNKEAVSLRGKLGEAETRWSEIVEEVGFDPIERESRLKSEVGKIQSEMDRLSSVQRELARRYKEIVQARPIADGNPRSLQAEKVLNDNQRVQGYQQRIVDLKLQKDELLEIRTDAHPDVVELQDRIDVLEQRFPEIIKEELAKSLVQFNDRKLNEILFESRKVALDRELKQEQLAAMKNKITDLTGKAVAFYPVKENFDRVRQEYRKLLANRINMQLAGAASFLGNVRLLDPTETGMRLPLKGVGAGPVFLSVLLALITAAAAAYLLEYVDVKVKNETDVRRYLNLPLLGIVPQASRSELTDIKMDGHEVAERFNTAATLVKTTARELDLRTFAVCSAISNEGKTTVSINMAASLARKGSKVILVDSDLRMPKVHSYLKLNNSYGLSTVLSGWVSPQQVLDGLMGGENQEGKTVAVREALQETMVPGLRVLTSGPVVSTPAKLIESELFPQVLKQLMDECDYVVFDTPPIDRVSDGLTIASMVDGCMFVVGSGQCEQRDITWAKHLLTNVQANLLGVFLNRYSHGMSREYSYYTRMGKKVATTA